MICADEAQEDIAATLGAKPIRVSTPTWSERLYSCKYEYADGVISLSVKELPDAAATTDYFEGLAKDRGQPPGGISLGEGAFATSTELVLRKDFMVLDVDVSDLPLQFGQPSRSPSDVKPAGRARHCWVVGSDQREARDGHSTQVKGRTVRDGTCRDPCQLRATGEQLSPVKLIRRLLHECYSSGS